MLLIREFASFYKSKLTIAITADLWTSIAIESYLTVRFHYLDAQWQMGSIISGILPLSDSHTVDNIVAWIKELVDDASIATEKVVAFVHDNCKNIDNAGDSLKDTYGWFSLHCAGHTLQLCVNSGLEIPAVSCVVAAGRCLTTHFHKSKPALRALKIYQQDMRVDQRQLIQDVKTCWNSTYFMIERLIDQRWPITAVLSDISISDRKLDLKSEQWELLVALKSLLHPLQVATTYFSKEFNVSSSALYPVLHGLLKSLQCSDDDLPAIQRCKTTVAQEIKRRWKLDSLASINAGSIVKIAPLISCIVDLRFKECKFLGANKEFEVKTALTTLVCKEQEGLTSHPEESNRPVPKKKCSGLDILLGDNYTNAGGDNELEFNPLLNKVDMYLEEKPIDREESPLVWWRENQHRFPKISKVARRFLTIPITSTPSEQVFSTAGLTVTRLHSSPTPEHVNMLVFLNKNSEH